MPEVIHGCWLCILTAIRTTMVVIMFPSSEIGRHTHWVGGAVFASFIFFIFDRVKENYATITITQERRFDAAHFEWGIAQALHIEDFQDERKALLVNNSCRIGAEVYVITYTATIARLSLLPKRTLHTNIWPIYNFLELGTKEYSPSFTVEGRSWY
ncbi:hypothetical protein Ancab_040579 [Ancistrocladus abbreviatus]